MSGGWGVLQEHAWNMPGIYLEHAWDFSLSNSGMVLETRNMPGLTMLVDLHDFWHGPGKQEHAWTVLACGVAWTVPGPG